MCTIHEAALGVRVAGVGAFGVGAKAHPVIEARRLARRQRLIGGQLQRSGYGSNAKAAAEEWVGQNSVFTGGKTCLHRQLAQMHITGGTGVGARLPPQQADVIGQGHHGFCRPQAGALFLRTREPVRALLTRFRIAGEFIDIDQRMSVVVAGCGRSLHRLSQTGHHHVDAGGKGLGLFGAQIHGQRRHVRVR